MLKNEMEGGRDERMRMWVNGDDIGGNSVENL